MLPDTLPITLNGFTFDMIRVEGGTFFGWEIIMSVYDDEKPAHQVELDAFYIGKYPVTQELWKAVMGQKTTLHFSKAMIGR